MGVRVLRGDAGGGGGAAMVRARGRRLRARLCVGGEHALCVRLEVEPNVMRSVRFDSNPNDSY